MNQPTTLEAEEAPSTPEPVPAPETARTLGRAERWAPLVAGVVLAIPTLLAQNLPMSDLPMHESVVGILRHLGDPAYFPSDLYRLNLGHPNQLFHVSAWLLSYAVGTTWACKLLVAFAQVAILVVSARLADHLGRSRWAALLVAPLALGFTYYWGLVANLLGFVAFFGALPLMDRAARAPTARSIAQVCAALVLMYFAHESVFVIAGGFAGLLAIAHPFDRRLTPMRFVPVVFGVVVTVGHFFWSLRFFPKSKVEIPAMFPTIWEKLEFLPADLFGSHDAETRAMLFGLGAAAIIAFAVARIRSKEVLPAGAGSAFARVQALLLHYRFEATAAAFTIAFALCPQSWNTATLLHARFLGPAWAFIALTAAPRSSPPRIAKFLAAVVPLGILLLSWPQFVDSDQTFRNLERVCARIPKNSAVALAALDRPAVRTRVYSASMGAARVVADRGGRMSLSLTPSPIAPVQIRPEYRWDELDRRLLLSSSRALKPSFDLVRFGWVIAQSRDPITRDLIVTAFKPDAELVAIEGEWILLKSTHPQIPLTSPDAPIVPKQHRTILDRVLHLVAIREEIQKGNLPADALDPPPWMRTAPPGLRPDPVPVPAPPSP